MATGKPRFYWDAAPLLAWITDEVRPDSSEMDGLAQIIELVEAGKAILMTSVLWRAEVLQAALSDEQRRLVTRAFQHRYIQELSIDARIMDLASELRSYHKNHGEKDALKNLRTPDAIHLASALQYDATEFHTFDGKKVSGGAAGLLTLNGNVGGRPLKVCVPKAVQLRLNYGSADANQATDTDQGED